MRQPVRWLYGTHVVEETLGSDRETVRELWIQRDRGKNSEDLARKARALGARVKWVSRRDLDKLSAGIPHQGLAVQTEAPGGEDLEAFLSGLDDKQRARTVLVALDQIQDPQNVGAIARSALCLGVSAILAPDRHTAGVGPGAARASAGALQKIPVYQVGNLAQTLRRLKEAGFWIYGGDMAGKAAWEVSFNTPFVLVVGSEGAGMRPLVQSMCDEVVAIPQDPGGVSSLNASAAAAVLLYEAYRQAHA